MHNMHSYMLQYGPVRIVILNDEALLINYSQFIKIFIAGFSIYKVLI